MSTAADRWPGIVRTRPHDRERPRPARAVAGQRRPRRASGCRGSGGCREAALLVPKVRYWEKQFLELSDDDMLDQEHGAARQGPRQVGPRHAAARGVRPRVASPSSGRSASGRSTCSSPPASSCTSAGWSNWRPAKARRSRASLPAFLNALAGKGVHVTTVNDYLAKRDAEWIGPVYQMLGLTVGVPPAEDGRRRTGSTAYQARHHLRHRRPSSASTSSATG